MLNQHGENVRETCSWLVDPTFERRLKQFDPRLVAVFDKTIQKWVILELAYDNSRYNVVLVCEDGEGNPKRLGEWVFNKLFVMHQKWLSLKNEKENGKDCLDQMIKEQMQKHDEEDKKIDNENIDMIKDDINQWRKAARELDGMPASDVTAGYAKRRDANEDV